MFLTINKQHSLCIGVEMGCAYISIAFQLFINLGAIYNLPITNNCIILDINIKSRNKNTSMFLRVWNNLLTFVCICKSLQFFLFSL